MAKKPMEEPRDNRGNQPGLLELYFLLQDIKPWLTDDAIRRIKNARHPELANALERLQSFLKRSFG